MEYHQQLIDTAATFLGTLDLPNGSSLFIQTSLLRAFLCEAGETLTTIQQEPTPHPTTNAILRELQAAYEAIKGLATPPASPLIRCPHQEARFRDYAGGD